MKKRILLAALIFVASCVRQPAPPSDSGPLSSPESVTGIRIVFEVDVAPGLRQTLEMVENKIRQVMRQRKIGYLMTPSADNGASICILDKARRDDAQIAIKDVVGNLENPGSTGVSSYQLASGGKTCFTVVETAEFRENFLNDVMSQEMFISERRATFGGRSPASARRLSDNRFQLDIPGLTDLGQMRRAFARSAELSFRLVNDNISVDDIREKRIPENTEILEQQPRAGKELPPLAVYRDAILPGTAIDHALVNVDRTVETPSVMVYLDDRYIDVFADITKKNIGRKLAIVLDGKILAAPILWVPIAGGALQITSDFTEEQATDFASLLDAGSLPPTLRIVDMRVTDLSKP